MRTTEMQGGGRPRRLRWVAFGTLLLAMGACKSMAPEPQGQVTEDLAEMQIRIRLLQTELALLRSSLADRDEDRVRSMDQERALADAVRSLQARIDSLPEELSGMCPEPSPAATLNTRCEPGQRVVVSGDKLVLGQVERVWMDPPARLLEARIDAGSETSTLDATEVVEFERDGAKWVRFQLTLDDEPTTVERPLKRYLRLSGTANGNGARRPAVDVRVQIGDVREHVEVILADIEAPQMLVLGRNFLTDVALVDVARQYVQPTIDAPE